MDKTSKSQANVWLKKWQELQSYGKERAAELDLQPTKVKQFIGEYRKSKKKK
jgi:hypothetical protein